jgi:hypothetical protein
MDKYKIDNQEYLLWIQGKWLNYQYVRVVLPWYAEIKEKKGVDVQEKEGRKIVSFYTQTPVWEETNFDIDYSLQNPKCQNYNFTFLKQAGIKEYSIKIKTNKWKIEEQNKVKQDFLYTEK